MENSILGKDNQWKIPVCVSILQCNFPLWVEKSILGHVLTLSRSQKYFPFQEDFIQSRYILAVEWNSAFGLVTVQLTNKPDNLPFKKALFLCRYVYLPYKDILHLKIQLFVTQSDQDPYTQYACLAPWIRIRVEIKSWIRIRIESQMRIHNTGMCNANDNDILQPTRMDPFKHLLRCSAIE